jgi:alpha-D-ribose 1-methylphosphonate 5-triphosphate synthase subunit PhnI
MKTLGQAARSDGARQGDTPVPIPTLAQLRTRLALADERLIELKTMLEDMHAALSGQTKFLNRARARRDTITSI